MRARLSGNHRSASHNGYQAVPQDEPLDDDVDSTSLVDVAGQPLLSLRKLRKVFGSRVAVDNVTLDVFKGECVGLLAVNGGGSKSFNQLRSLPHLSTETTTIKMATGQLPVTSGTAIVAGHDVRIAKREAQVRYYFSNLMYSNSYCNCVF